MEIITDRNSGTIQWIYNNKEVQIKIVGLMYAFEYGNNMIMAKTSTQKGVGFTIYYITGEFILSYITSQNIVFLPNNKDIYIDQLLTVQYSSEDKIIVALVGLDEEDRKIIIFDDNGEIITKIEHLNKYTFSSLKNDGKKIIVVCHGDETTVDQFGRNDWNFELNLKNYYLEKLSITN